MKAQKFCGVYHGDPGWGPFQGAAPQDIDEAQGGAHYEVKFYLNEENYNFPHQNDQLPSPLFTILESSYFNKQCDSSLFS